MFKLRPSQERGFADRGWLKSYHSFSFADYYDLKYTNFSSLRVINEDWIAPAQGFGKHPHKNMEIITYPVSGTLRHADSLGHQSDITHGTIQRISAGKGILHSEFNPSSSEEVHLLQIWIEANKENVPPRYDEMKLDLQNNQALLVASETGKNNSMAIYQDAEIWAFSGSEEWTYQNHEDRPLWLQLIKGQLRVNDLILNVGDGLAITDEASLAIKPSAEVEYLFFVLPK
jgi:redox-sensitive bicupin YhaK (pirin superfamily)